MNKYDVIEVSEALYYEKNPDTKMDVPSSVYETVEKWRHQWLNSGLEISLYDWIKLNKI